MNSLIAESFGSARLCFRSFFFTILWRGRGFQRTQKPHGDACYFVDCGQKRVLIGFRGLVEAADFPYELQRGRANFFLGDWRIKIEKSLDVPAHGLNLLGDGVVGYRFLARRARTQLSYKPARS
jgi:hypothetical protein